MQFSTKALSVEKIRTGCVIVPVLAGRELSASGKLLDATHDGCLSAALKTGDLEEKAGTTLLVRLDKPNHRALLVSLGDAREVSEKLFREAAAGAFRAAATLASDDAVSLLGEVSVAGRDDHWTLAAQVMVGRAQAYSFERLKSKSSEKKRQLARVVMCVPKAQAGRSQAVAQRAMAIANGVDLARDLGNLPANVCTPTYLAHSAGELATEFKLRLQVLEEKQMLALRMGAFLSVSRGSEQPPKLIVLHYQGAAESKAPVVLVGKGVTFDSGGISIKPAAGMDEMKYDMCGAASVLGTIRAIAEMKLKINVVGIIPACENLPSGRASKPGDIVTTMSGQTVEILNTDAEGRLILCDALTYAERFKPAAVVDIATLTGACVIALGHHNSGLFSPHDALANDLLSAGRDSADTCWRMPLDEPYQEQLKSPFADMANVGDRSAGSVTAACFLSRYAKAYDWAHLDIAGTAWKSGKDKGATGRPVPLLASFLINRATRS